MSAPTIGQVVSTLDKLYDPAWADDWDSVGLVCGDPNALVAKILFAVDPVLSVAQQAVNWGADLLVVHHPLLLDPVHSVAATTPKGAVVHLLVGEGVALHVCHTNADTADPGVSDVLGASLGLRDLRPLVPATAEELDKVVTFVPSDDAERLIDALAAAGAGSLGAYERCAFTSAGVGTFRPGLGADPAIGSVGEVTRVNETRIEMVLPRARRSAVLAELLDAHPYEEPAYDLLEIASRPGARGSGRIGSLPEVVSLHEFAEQVAAALPRTAVGVRVAGAAGQPVRTVAVCGGAGGSLLDQVRASGADAFVTSDLSHHRASEFREHATWSDQSGRTGTALIEVSHWAAESLWLRSAADRLSASLGEAGSTVVTRTSDIVTDPWTFQVQPDAATSKETIV